MCVTINVTVTFISRSHSFSALTSLKGLLSLDLKEMENRLTSDLYKKLTRAVAELDLKVWLEEQDLNEEVMSVLLRDGLNSRQKLCGLQLEDTLQASFQLTQFSIMSARVSPMEERGEGEKERERKREGS